MSIVRNWMMQGGAITDLNVVVEGHSFMIPNSSMEYLFPALYVPNIVHNISVSGCGIDAVISRAATIDSYLVEETTSKKNVLVLWIGVNDIINTVGQGTTLYNSLKSYVQARVNTGWKVFTFTMTPSNAGRSAIFESERNIFNNLCRNDLSLVNNLFLLDTDTIAELQYPVNSTFFGDNLHPTIYGAYLSHTLLVSKLRQKYGYKIIVQPGDPVTFTLTTSGNGTGVSMINLTTSQTTVATLSGSARFYSDSEGTLNESNTWNITTGKSDIIYVRCSSGTANLTLSNNSLIQWGNSLTIGWTSGTNAAILGGIFNKTTTPYMIANYISGNNTIAMNITGYDSHLTCIRLFGNGYAYGDITTLLKLSDLRSYGVNTDIYGDLTGLPLTYVFLQYNKGVLGTLTGDITNIGNYANSWLMVSGANTLYGSVAGLVNVIHLVITGSNTLTGDIAALTKLYRCGVTGNSTLSYSNVTNIPNLSDLYVNSLVTLTSENVNQLLADFWLNKDSTGKIWATRSINIAGSASSGSPTGQGIIDKAALQAYRSPTPPGTAALWTVTTR
ncbi:MAG: hypothetical protein WC516_09290 [Patescibacteria group bacterium]|jgi:hypothetical protein